MSRTKPSILATRTLARTRIFEVEEVHLRFANGVETRYERLIGSPHGAVLTVALNEAGEVLLIREYAVGLHRYELGLPKGRIEAGESPLLAGVRELREETGFGAGRAELLGALTLAPGYSTQLTHVVLARDLHHAPLLGDEPEPIEVVPWPMERLAELIQVPECSEARTLAALFMAREHLLREGAP
ncbi:MAG: ADP compounds hydrolase NudE [Halothiobacillaceae bacterium]|nr:MAG: ADP compounds hydrolase NudE [Halothiobacillaceae bacterium]